MRKARVATEVAKRSAEVDLKKQLSAQKATYEAAMKRHLEFVDQARACICTCARLHARACACVRNVRVGARACVRERL